MKDNYKKTLIVKTFLLALGGVALVLLIFQAGVMVGYRQASFSYRWGDNYGRMFFGGFHPMMGAPAGFGQEYPINGHGAVGRIIKISGSTMVVADRDNTEKVILLNNQTIVRSFRESIKSEQLKVDDSVMVIGTPNDQSQIVAKLIRLIPPLPAPRVLPVSATSTN